LTAFMLLSFAVFRMLGPQGEINESFITIGGRCGHLSRRQTAVHGTDYQSACKAEARIK
jgi:hypothetical protein